MKRLLAASLSVAMLAGCADLSGTLNTARVTGTTAATTAAKTGTTGLTVAKAATTSAAAVKAANAAKVTIGATSAVQSAAAAAQLESDIEGYNAIAEAAEATDSTVTSGYSLKALGTAQADARPSRGSDAFDAWGLDAGTSPNTGRSGFGQAPQRQADDDQPQWQQPATMPTMRGGSRGNIQVATTVVVINLPSRMPRYNPGQKIVIQTIAAKPADKRGTGKQGKGKGEDNRTKKQQAAVPSAEAQAIKDLLALAHWNHDASDSTLLVKEATQELSHTDGKGGTVGRKIHLKRVVKAGTGELIEAFTDLEETLADGTKNNAHWEKTLQDDGSYHAVFHLEQNLADGAVKVTNWEKTIAANGDITGSGTITTTDANGVVTSSESLNLGGSTATQETVDTAGTTTATDTTTTPDTAATGAADTTATDTATTTTDTAATDSATTTTTTTTTTTDTTGQ